MAQEGSIDVQLRRCSCILHDQCELLTNSRSTLILQAAQKLYSKCDFFIVGEAAANEGSWRGMMFMDVNYSLYLEGDTHLDQCILRPEPV